MSSEKMAILKMLEDGKITADNATKLLAALGESDRTAGSGSYARSEDSSGTGGGYKSQSNERTSGTSGKEKTWAADLGKKIEVVARDLEPRLTKLAGVVVEKSVEVVDMATKSIHNSRAAYEEKTRETARRTGGASTADAARPASSAGSFDGTYELAVSPDVPNELIIKSPKGSVNIKGYNGDKASVRFTFSRRGAGNIEFVKLGCVYQFNYDMDAFSALSVDAFIPYAMFRHIVIETTDGNVSADNIKAEKITVNTAKCHITCKNITSDSLKIDNLDGAVLLSNSTGLSLTAENANGAIDATNTDFKTLKLETTAEPVSIISQGFYKYNDYNWTVRTSNARLKAGLPISGDTAYEIKAYTSLSDVSNGLSGLNYSRNDRNCIEGKSENYGYAAKKVRIDLDTSNAPLTIN